MNDGVIAWLVITGFLFAFAAIFAGLALSEGERSDARACAIFALTAWAWPLWLFLLLTYGATALVCLAFDTSNPLQILMKRVGWL